jgi:hypothetical protein
MRWIWSFFNYAEPRQHNTCVKITLRFPGAERARIVFVGDFDRRLLAESYIGKTATSLNRKPSLFHTKDLPKNTASSRANPAHAQPKAVTN